MTYLKLTKLLLATFHNIIYQCKLQLRDHTYTMIGFSQTQLSSHLQSKGTPVFDWFGMAALIKTSNSSQVATHTFFIL